MGFPTWTLVGMGVAALAALVFILIAYLALSPSALLRLGLTGARLDLRVKSFIGYALASLLLLVGFFIAGVPLGSVPDTAVSTPITNTLPATGATVIVFATPTLEETAVPAAANDDEPAASGAMGSLPATEEGTSSSGSFAPITDDPEATVEETTTPLPDAGPSQTPVAELSTTPITVTPTATPSPSPTITPTPTLTPTPIDGDTAVLELDGSVIWLQRSPGGQNLIVLQDQALVILRNGRANRNGLLWRQVTSVDGVTGWLQEIYLNDEK